AENTVKTAVVYDANGTEEGGTVHFSLTGTDASLFTIDANTGEVRFINSPNFEAPTDADHNNVYDIVVHGNDGVHENTLAVAINVTNVNEAPGLTSGVGAFIAENTAASTVIYDANGTDPDGDAITYSLSGADSTNFSIDANTGEVRFLNAPD